MENPYLDAELLEHRGKVRDTFRPRHYAGLILPVATDRISTHNVLHETLVPGKGELLTALTLFWYLTQLRGIPNHIVAYGQGVYRYLRGMKHPKDIHRRLLVVKELEPMIPYEFVWRNNHTGSLYALTQEGKDPYGLGLSKDLPKMYRFPEPLFTPTRKSEHDEPVPARDVSRRAPAATELTRKVFLRLGSYLEERSLALVDSKFEVGLDKDGRPVLADEWGTGDSSRIVWAADIVEGKDPPWLDKEVFRREAMRMWGSGEKVPLRFPEQVTAMGTDKYHQAFLAITGMTLRAFQKKYMD